MGWFVKILYSYFAGSLLIGLLGGSAFAFNFTADELQEILKISKNIKLAQPNLSDLKKVEYSVGVFRASKKFQIPPNLLIAIAAQETSFREDLPEGKAGEFGIVQIRKIWMRNPTFRKQFKDAKLEDLLNPERAFMFAAWILKDLRENSPKSSIPYWSFYNARGFRPRFKYFLSVNQKLAYLNKGIPFTREIAANVQINGSANESSWRPDVRVLAAAKTPTTETWTPEPIKISKPKDRLITTASLGEGITIQPDGWIAEAIKRLQQKAVQNSQTNPNRANADVKIDPSKHIAFEKTAPKLLKSVQD